MKTCFLNAPPFYQCCCNCKLQKRLVEKSGCEDGFVCLLFEEEGVVLKDESEHSCGCECYDKK